MKIIKYSPKNEKEIIHEAIKVLKRGGLIVYPTDTIYGIGCNATNKRAVNKIYKIKKRPKNKPLSILCSSMNMANKYVKVSNKAKKMLPGKHTFILPTKTKLPVSDNNIGIRIPNHWCTKLARALGKPITSTSANISGKKTPSTIKDIEKTFSSKINLYINAGTLSGKPSKIYSIKEKRLR
jgi:tRNA threonylcarbamoyl adenosine modification protein (Sua5/YciO/YrdC/YwlC family)